MSNKKIKVGNIECGADQLFVISGPCVIEEETIMMKTAEKLKEISERMRIPVLLIQVNHWDRAIQTQILNFPNAIHLNASVETPDPVAIIPWLHIDLLVGSPECITFSSARGKKKKIREQSRSSAAFLLR